MLLAAGLVSDSACLRTLTRNSTYRRAANREVNRRKISLAIGHVTNFSMMRLDTRRTDRIRANPRSSPTLRDVHGCSAPTAISPRTLYTGGGGYDDVDDDDDACNASAYVTTSYSACLHVWPPRTLHACLRRLPVGACAHACGEPGRDVWHPLKPLPWSLPLPPLLLLLFGLGAHLLLCKLA